MKTKLLTPLAMMALLSGGFFSCASSGEVSDNTGMEPTEVVVTETEVATATTPEGNTVVIADTDVVADTTVMTPQTQQMSNTAVAVDDMFEDIDNTEQYDVLALARMSPNLSTFVQLVELSGLAPSLSTAGPVTLFAPTNDAFNQLPKERLAELIDEKNRVQLMELIQMHILPSEVSSIQFNNSQFIDRGEQEDIPINTDMNGTVVYVGGAQIVQSDVEASNGVVHVVNGIIETSDQAGADID